MCRSVDALRRLVLMLVLAALAPAAPASTPTPVAAKRSYDISAGDAAVTLQRYVEQSGEQILYVVPAVRGVKTNAVVAECTAREAIERMVAKTVLIVVEDPQTGAVMIQRGAPTHGPPAPAPAPPPKTPKTAQPKHNESPPVKNRNFLSFLGGWLAAGAAVSAQTALATPPAKEDPVVLSPFTVTTEKDAGYYGASTVSGTRMNTKLEDIGASISVVTKQQMLDLALLNMDDIFAYEAGTEGTTNYTAFSFDRNQVAIDNTQFDPLNANRIRGVGPANVSFGNFETSNRTPIDVLDVDAVEIGRGPNNNIFGIGSAAGTVNSVRASANLSRNRSQVSARTDSYGGYRTSLDLNRVLKSGKLAIRGTAVAQREGFQLKPSGVMTERSNGMLRFQPFKKTSIAGSYSYYHSYGNRPNTTTPREAITAWRSVGSPTWNPTTNSATVSGVTTVGAPSYFNRNYFSANTMFAVDPGGLLYWMRNQGGGRLLEWVNQDPTGYRTTQPLINDYPALTSKEIYDWSRINLGAPNFAEDKSELASVLVDQSLFSTERQGAFLQLGWFREQTDRYGRNLLGNLSQSIVSVDVNQFLPDGRANPGFLRPYTGVDHQVRTEQFDRDTYRAQLAYKMDFTADRSWIRWLGRHDAVAFYEYKDFKSWTRYYMENIVDSHPSWTAKEYRPYTFFYLGDNQGQNVDYAPAGYRTPGTYPITSNLYPGGAWGTEPALLAPAWNSGTLSWSEFKSRGATVQSHLLQDRIITTFGVRRDARYSRAGATPVLNSDGYTVNEASFLKWAAGDWNSGKGPTRTAGIVARPWKWLSLYANKSDSFQPSSPVVDIYQRFLPDPFGKGEDYGVSLNLFSGRLIVRANHYTTKQMKSRNGTIGLVVGRINYVDHSAVSGQSPFSLQALASSWVTATAAAQGRTLTQSEINNQVAAIMQVPVAYLDPFQYSFSSTSDLIARGNEVELNYNPTKWWTIKVNVTETESIQANIGKEVGEYLAARLKVWPTIIDPTSGRPWFTSQYGGGQTPEQYVAANITAPLNLQLTTEGLSNPQVRKYRCNVMTNIQLAGLTDHPVVRRLNIGGALRWEDKGAIGYWGKQQAPAIILDYNPNRPIYDRDHLYVDAFAGYRTRLFRDKVGTTFQFNVRNLAEGGRLQPIAADPDGSISAWRIVSRRQFIFTTTFDF